MPSTRVRCPAPRDAPRPVTPQIPPQRRAGISDAKHLRPRPRRRALGHRHPRQVERERAIVMPHFADAILGTEHGKSARGLDADEILAVTKIEKIRRRDHHPLTVSRLPLPPRIASGARGIACCYGTLITAASVLRNSVASALGGRLSRNIAWTSKVSCGLSGRIDSSGVSEACAVKLSTTVIPTPS